MQTGEGLVADVALVRFDACVASVMVVKGIVDREGFPTDLASKLFLGEGRRLRCIGVFFPLYLVVFYFSEKLQGFLPDPYILFSWGPGTIYLVAS